LRERLFQEQETNAGLKVEERDNTGVFKVSGRGELHLTVLIETMRREGYEMAVAKPEVIMHEENGQIVEPAEELILDIEEKYQGAVMENMGHRGGQMKDMVAETDAAGVKRVRLEYIIATRCLLGFKNEFLILTKGSGVMHQSFHGFIPKGDEIELRINGVLIAMEPGETTAYALNSLQDRSTLFVKPRESVYGGMVVGENARPNDMVVNPCKKKALTNMRAAGSDDLVLLAPPRVFSLEQAIEYIERDELVEVTPKSIRIRKKFLSEHDRKRAEKN
jgi:GTP-binding protein